MERFMPTYFVSCFIIVIINIIVLIRRISDSGKSVWVEDFGGLLKKNVLLPRGTERGEGLL